MTWAGSLSPLLLFQRLGRLRIFDHQISQAQDSPLTPPASASGYPSALIVAATGKIFLRKEGKIRTDRVSGYALKAKALVKIILWGCPKVCKAAEDGEYLRERLRSGGDKIPVEVARG